MKKTRKILAIIITIFLFQSSALIAYADSKTLSVPVVTQSNTNWCWAASSYMTGKYLYSGSTRTQSQIVAYVKGSSSSNNPANVFETADASQYATHNKYNFSGSLLTTSYLNVKDYINSYYPIQALVYGNDSGHFYVIYGYNDSAASTGYLYIIDPWDGRGKYVSYYDFDNGNWSESRPWINSVIS